MPVQMPKRYSHKESEPRIYKMWEDGDYFKAHVDETKEPFTIILPPPNASGKMHTGNVLMLAIEDLLIRWKRMQGYNALWIPGTDHAGIETQVTFERELNKEGKSRLDFDRNTLYKKIWDFVHKNKSNIEGQIRSMGASVDWSRYKFTLDESSITTTTDTFKKLHDEGLIYRDEYLVNYCPICGSTYADVELKHEQRQTPMYYIKYKLVEPNGNDPEFLTVATTRPEPIFVDTHVAVNPDDKSKSKFIGRKVLNPLTGAEMEVVADEFVDPEFGTGVVKMTPAHDKNDFEAAKKHNIPIISAFDLNGKVNERGGELAGLSIKNARERAVEIIKEKGLLEKIDEVYENTTALCKGGHVIEPMVLPNWFVKIDTLKKPAHDVVKEGKVKIYPEWQEVKYHRWMEEMHDWAISRQVVWGIRMPVWYDINLNPDLTVTFLSKDKSVKAGKISELLKEHSLDEIKEGLQVLFAPVTAQYSIGRESPGEQFLQETDTFDTWFSSGQWPLILLNYPESEDFKYFYPTSVLETGWEILRLWVSRMIMFGIYLTGEVPFREVYLHGLVYAIDGRKMSKSLGNVVNPEEYQEEFGTDALRMGLIAGTATGQDFNFPHDRVVAYRNFANKIWNMARFMLMMFDNFEESGAKVLEFNEINKNSLHEKDLYVLKELNNLINTTNSNLEKYRFADAGNDIYHFMWDLLASDYIEHVKEREDKEVALGVLKYVYLNSLKLLHPFMPFVTEEIWNLIPKDVVEPLIAAKWPETGEF